MADNETSTAAPARTGEADNALAGAVHATGQATDQQTASGEDAPVLLQDPNATDFAPAAETVTPGAPGGTKPHGSTVNTQSAEAAGIDNLT